jgi:uncharacterized protein (DUF433 family)
MNTGSMSYLVPAAEAAFIANLPDKDMQRMFDAEIVESPLVQRAPEFGRRWARLAAAFAKFYYEEDQMYTVWARRETIKQLSERVANHKLSYQIYALLEVDKLDWKVSLHGQTINVFTYVAQARERQDRIEAARGLIVEDPDVMGGVPVFKGTRLPVSMVSSLAAAGQTWSDLREDYPSLTQEMFDAAQTYQAIHPRRGRPPAEKSNWIVRSSKVVKPASRAA